MNVWKLFDVTRVDKDITRVCCSCPLLLHMNWMFMNNNVTLPLVSIFMYIFTMTTFHIQYMLWYCTNIMRWFEISYIYINTVWKHKVSIYKSIGQVTFGFNRSCQMFINPESKIAFTHVIHDINKITRLTKWHWYHIGNVWCRYQISQICGY